ncbi:MAG: D-alanyl-D-alanine carboxypeptidase family protein [Clostridiales Family XIII bacterium]|jgi:D-alanyl-D-alanine dipeptidase/carboxypeptidase|nr:D-alanyl-D-alanine carboxypeptidase family protein [Clostridiales Family XIII bacterium]
MKQIILANDEVWHGNMILANAESSIINEPDANSLIPPFLSYPEILLERCAATMLMKLQSEIYGLGTIIPIRGYCPKDKLASIACPDQVEHQTGLAIDFIRPAFSSNDICDEFIRKASKFGFIQRYPKNKADITGAASEPWHFRYVGYPHSMIIENEELSLEEYHAYIKQYTINGTHYSLCNDGQSIEIFYVPATSDNQRITIDIPAETIIQVSGNNLDGFIITMWKTRNSGEFK